MPWINWIRCLIRKIIHLLVCAFGGKPPMGASPTAGQKATIESIFPDLQTWSVTGPATSAYNCIAWSVGVTNQWLWPGSAVADFDAFYASYGWTVSANGNREYQKRKVALYAYNSDSNMCTHGSREVHDCNWEESKLGSLERIMHRRTELEGGGYGDVIKYYEKADPAANLDLCP